MRRRPTDPARLRTACLFLTGAAIGGAVAWLPQPIPTIGAGVFLVLSVIVTWQMTR